MQADTGSPWNLVTAWNPGKPGHRISAAARADPDPSLGRERAYIPPGLGRDFTDFYPFLHKCLTIPWHHLDWNRKRFFSLSGTEVKMKTGRALTIIPVALALAAALLATSSCGGGEAKESTTTTTKLPPGMAGSDSAASGEISTSELEAAEKNWNYFATTGESSTTATEGTAAGEVEKTATLSGVQFTVVAARRQDNNKLVASSGTREVNGDFLEVELRIRNVGDSLADLSRFSFRLWNPYIQAASYDDYYGNVTTYGGYVSSNIVSAALLDYANLQQVSVTLRIGEEIDDVFLFYDLNPLSVSRNEGLTKEGSNLVIYDTWTGEKAEINLAGFPD